MSSSGKGGVEAPRKRGHGKVVDAVRSVLPTIALPDFTVDDVARVLEAMPGEHNRVSVSSALVRLRGAGEIEVVEEGKGSRPSRYRRKEARP